MRIRAAQLLSKVVVTDRKPLRNAKRFIPQTVTANPPYNSTPLTSVANDRIYPFNYYICEALCKAVFRSVAITSMSPILVEMGNRLKIALRNAANAIGNLKDSTPLRDFFQRINYRKGRVSAISATARKLTVIIWNVVVKNTPYVNPEGYLFLDQKRK